jgi:hypothetical protein
MDYVKMLGVRITEEMYKDLEKAAGGKKYISRFVRKLITDALSPTITTIDPQPSYVPDVPTHHQPITSETGRPRRVSDLNGAGENKILLGDLGEGLSADSGSALQ